MNWLLVGIGSALGAALRVWLGDWSPWGTTIANVGGSALIGWYAAARAAAQPRMRHFVMDGICGGFTTFSVFSVEVLALATAGTPIFAAGHAVLTVALSLTAVWAGWRLGTRGNPPDVAVAS